MIDWRASDAPPVYGIESKCHLCSPSSSAVDHLGLVQTDTPPLDACQGRGNRRVTLGIPESSSLSRIAVGQVNIVKLLGQNLVSGDHNIKLRKSFGLMVFFNVNTPERTKTIKDVWLT